MLIPILMGLAAAAPSQATPQSPTPQQPAYASGFAAAPYRAASEPAAVEWSRRTEWRFTPPRLEFPRIRRVVTPEARLVAAPPPRVEPRATIMWQYPLLEAPPAPSPQAFTAIPPPTPPGKLIPAAEPPRFSLPPLPTKSAGGAGSGSSSCDTPGLSEVLDRLESIQDRLDRLERDRAREDRPEPLPNPDAPAPPNGREESTRKLAEEWRRAA